MPVFHYINPITRAVGQSLRDHFILKVGPRWYMTGTSQPVWGGPNPGVHLLVSDNLQEWTEAGWLVDASRLPEDCWYNGRFWAPEIHAAHGRFYLTVSSGHAGPEHGERRMDNHGIVLFVANAVTGPYALVNTEGPIGRGFKNDASLFTDDDGRSYLYGSGGGLWQSAIDLTDGTLQGGDLQKICGPHDPGLPDWMIGGIEGPFVLKRHRAYWMFFSAWTRGYEIGVLHADSPLGPWTLTPDSPIFGTRKRRYRQRQMEQGGYAHLVFDDTPDPYVEVGHNAVFEGPDGKDWLCCHYFLEGTQIVSSHPVVQYADTQEHLGIEPLAFENGHWRVHGPTWTPQTVAW